MLYNIPFSESFIDVFCKKLLEDNKNNKENLFNYLILVPNTRIIRSLQTGFLKNSNASALILPKMISVSDINYVMSSSSALFKDKYQKEFEYVLKPIVSSRERSFILAKLIKKMDNNLTFSQTLSMADDLGLLIDKAYLEDVNFKDLDKIVESNLANHWQEILKFLHIATYFWPQILKEKNAIDVTLKQKLTLELQNKIWQNNPPKQHVVALNLLSFYETNINLIKTINNLPSSDIYFYGIDKNMKDEVFNNLDYTHPQKIVSFMLNKLNWQRKDILDIYNTKQENILHRVFDNVINKDCLKQDIKDFASKFSFITTKNEEEESRVIALAMREALETEGKTAGLITNNKNLITRVKNELNRWNIEIDDYLGSSLFNSLQAKFFLLVGNIIAKDFLPEDFLALLKHPFCLMGLERGSIYKYSKNLDFYLFRNLLFNKNISSYKNEIKKMEYLNEKIKKELIFFFSHIEENFSEIFQLIRASKNGAKINFQKTLITHIEIAEKFSLNKETTQSNLWKEQEGKELSLLLVKLLEESKEIGEVSVTEYIEILKKSILDINIRSIYNKHPRLYIYGELQNTLIHHDLLIVSNMNEGSMPILPLQNLWMNYSMMSKLGFLNEEAQIGLRTNIFAQTLGSPEIILTRSEKEQGKLSTPSRWWLKLQTFLQYYNSAKDLNLNKKDYIYGIQNKMHIPNTFTPLILDNVNFNPPIEYRPKKISATQFEALLKNPYVFFIDKILRIKPLDRINPVPNKKDYGNSLHKALEHFFSNLNTFKTIPKENLFSNLMKIVEDQFKTFLESPTFKLFKMPIIKKGIYELLISENLEDIKKTYIEIEGSIPIKIGEINLTLVGKADRIDILQNNNINIFDYKTTANDKVEKYWKQLLILSLILHNNGFAGINYNFEDINTKYIFFPNKTTEKLQKKDNGITNIVEYIPEFIVELEKELTKYYTDGISYEFNLLDKKVYEDHKHFIRFDEWNTNFSLTQVEEEN